MIKRTIIEIKDEILERLNAEQVKDKIMSDLSLEEKSGKVRCMIHNDKHPSMSFYNQGKLFKCFSCNGTYDIITHYERFYGLSFKDSLEKINEDFHLNVDMDFKVLERDKVKPRKKATLYNDLSNPTIEYLEKRGLSRETIEFAGIKSDNKNNIVFQYRDIEGKVISNKYRPSRKVKKGELKSWFEKETNCNTLFMIDKCDYESLIITEGEIDCLCLYEMGYKNVVSVPTGCHSTEWIDVNFEFLKQVKGDILIFFDSDEAGQEGADIVSRRLNAKIVKLDEKYKDINEALFKGDLKAIKEAIENASYPPLVGVKSLEDEKCHDYTKYDPKNTVDSGIYVLDRYLDGFSMNGCLSVITGYNESGKSSFVNQLTAQALKQNHKVFVYSGELTLPIYKTWLYQCMCKPEHLIEVKNRFGDSLYKISDYAEELLDKYTKDKLYYVEGGVSITSSVLLQKMEEVYMRTGTRIFVLDNLMTINFDNGATAYEAQSRFMAQLKDFCTRYRVLIHLIAHPRKPDGNPNNLSKFEISGSSDISNYSDYIIGLVRSSTEEKEKYYQYLDQEEAKKEECKRLGVAYVEDEKNAVDNPFDVTVKILKNRPTGVSDKSLKLSFSRDRRRFFYSYDEFNVVYPYDEEVEQVEMNDYLNDSDDENLPF